MQLEATLSDALTLGESWDRYWLSIIAGDPLRLVEQTTLDDLQKLPISAGTFEKPATFFSAPVARIRRNGQVLAAAVWARAEEIISRRVVEFGCGTGLQALALSLHTSRYLGIETSQVALASAARKRHPKLRFTHVSDTQMLYDLRGTFDLAFASNVCSHLNFDHTVRLLNTARALLRRGGTLSLDFTATHPAQAPGGVVRSFAPQNLSGVTAGYWYTREELQALANVTHLSVVDIEEAPALGKYFLRLRRD